MATFYTQVIAFREVALKVTDTDKAEDELEPIDQALDELLWEVADLEGLGDMYTKYELIDEAKRTYAKIPRFDEAHARWKTQAKRPDVKASIAAGEDYAEIFEELAELKEKLRKAQAKNAKMSPSKRSKAEERALASHQSKLESLVEKLKKMAERHGEDTYYGRAARDSVDAFVASGKKTLTDKRRK